MERQRTRMKWKGFSARQYRVIYENKLEEKIEREREREKERDARARKYAQELCRISRYDLELFRKVSTCVYAIFKLLTFK